MSASRSQRPSASTRSTRPSSTAAMASDWAATVRGVNTFWTMPRRWVCWGGSWATIISFCRSPIAAFPGMVEPPVDEKASVSLLAAAMSSQRVSDQNSSPTNPTGFLCTGSCSRSSANTSSGGPSAKFFGSLRSTSRSVLIAKTSAGAEQVEGPQIRRRLGAAGDVLERDVLRLRLALNLAQSQGRDPHQHRVAHLLAVLAQGNLGLRRLDPVLREAVAMAGEQLVLPGAAIVDRQVHAERVGDVASPAAPDHAGPVVEP